MGKIKLQYIQVEGVEVSFKDRRIFSLDQFTLYKGDRVGIVGVNGAGKTTLMNVLSGDYIPQKGRVMQTGSVAYFRQFDEADATGCEDGKLRKEFKITGVGNADTVSGGENTRIRLAEVFAVDADVVLLDEPTSNLDRKGITLLKDKLLGTETFLLITHDRRLLTSLCNRIIEIENERVTVYEMGYQEYVLAKEEDRKRRQREYEAYIAEKKRLQSVFNEKKKHAQEIGKGPTNMSPREARLRNFLASRPYDCKQLAMERQAKAIISRISHLEVKEKPKELAGIHLDFMLTNPPQNRRVIKVEHLNCAYGSKEVLRDVSFSVKNGAKAAILGGNGAGKTTLLNAIIARKEGVYVVPKAKIGYFHQQFEQLDMEKSVLENVMRDSIQKEETARTILARLLLDARFMNEPVGRLSGGEKGKVAVAKLLVSDMNLLVLDEPTNYLDLPSVEALTKVLKEYEGTLLFVSHDEAFVEELATMVLSIEDKEVEAFEGTLKEYDKRKDHSAEKERLHVQIQALEMRLVELISRLSIESEKKGLEQEYEETLRQLSSLKNKQ